MPVWKVLERQPINVMLIFGGYRFQTIWKWFMQCKILVTEVSDS